MVRAADASQHQHAYLTQIFATRERTTGIAHDIQNRPLHAHTLGPMNRLCSGCNALHFACEQSASNKSVCSACRALGKVTLQLFENFPSILRGLYTEQDRVSKNFRENIRNYNSGLAMASMVANIEAPPGRGPYCFRVHGQVYHAIGGLRPPAGSVPQCAQVLIMDTDDASQELAGRPVNRNCQATIFATLHRLLRTSNPYAQSFKLMADVAETEAFQARHENRKSRSVRMVFAQTSAQDQRRYNTATANEVAIVFIGDEENIPGERLFVIHENTGTSVIS